VNLHESIAAGPRSASALVRALSGSNTTSSTNTSKSTSMMTLVITGAGGVAVA
jgi:hypothetical protein